MASSPRKEQLSEQTQTIDSSTENTMSHALLDAGNTANTLDEITSEGTTITDPGKKKANDSANDTVVLSSTSTESRTPEQIEEEKKKILTQVEYYFGDKNLPNDKFLNEVRSKNPQGWVPLKMICKFKKMQVYKDYDLIIEALRKSSNLLEVDEQGEHVRRKTLIMIDIPQHIKDSPIWRSIYVKGFNKDEVDSNYEKEVASYFSQYSKVEKAFARREDDGTYKDSFFIQFDTHEEAKKMTEMDISYKNVKLTMMMKFDYCEMKCIEKGLDPNTMRLQKQQTTKREKRPNNNRWVPGCLLHFEDAGPNSTYSTIRTQMHNHFGDVKYVQYDSKNSSGVIEFEHPITHKITESTPFEELKFDGVKPKLRVLKGNEERDYYHKRKNAMLEKTKQSNALKAEFGITPEESSGNNTSTNVRGRGRVRGTVRSRGYKAEKQRNESDGKRKSESQDEPDDDASGKAENGIQKKIHDDAASGQSPTKRSRPDEVISEDDTGPTKKSRVGEVAPEVLSSSSERKRKAIDLDDSNRPPVTKVAE